MGDMGQDYPEFVARFYDTVYTQVRDGVDNDFYLRAIAAARGPVLEIGVGTGRLFTEALRRVPSWPRARGAACISRTPRAWISPDASA
jgi:hypothetical protein